MKGRCAAAHRPYCVAQIMLGDSAARPFGSDGDAVRGQEGDRVDVRTVRRARADLEVQVRAGGVAGGTGEAELLTGAHGLTRGDGDGGQVAVLRVVAVGVLDDDLVAVRAAPAAW